MLTFIIILIVLCAIASPSDTSQHKSYSSKRELSRKDRKRIQKQIDRAKMDAWEDMVMYMEVFSDD